MNADERMIADILNKLLASVAGIDGRLERLELIARRSHPAEMDELQHLTDGH